MGMMAIPRARKWSLRRGLTTLQRPPVRLLLVGILGCMVLIAFGLLIWSAPALLEQAALNDPALKAADRLTAEHNARLLVISLGGALAVSGGLLYTARNYRLTRRGQMTERFTKALERLGSSEPYVRIGGIHALKHVMRDSPDHHGDIVEVLVAFIRDRTPRVAVTVELAPQWMHPPTGVDEPAPSEEPASDVQAALTALGNRPARPRHERDALDLHGLHLQGVRLGAAHLEGANLRGSCLAKASLWGAHLEGAYLQGAHLENADLWDAHLEAAYLQEAHLEDARLWSTHLERAHLGGAHLEGTRMGGVNLTGTDLTGIKIDDRTTLPDKFRELTTPPT